MRPGILAAGATARNETKKDLLDLSMRFIDKTRQVGRLKRAHLGFVGRKRPLIMEERTGSLVLANG
jgi:hypothetical protein